MRVVCHVASAADSDTVLLGVKMPESDQWGYHIWLPMPQREAQRLADAASALGVLVTPPASTAAPDVQAGGVRLCLGAASLSELSTALTRIARLRMDIPAKVKLG